MTVCVCMVWRDRRRRPRSAADRAALRKFWRSGPFDRDRALAFARGMTTERGRVWLEAAGAPASDLRVE